MTPTPLPSTATSPTIRSRRVGVVRQAELTARDDIVAAGLIVTGRLGWQRVPASRSSAILRVPLSTGQAPGLSVPDIASG